MEVKDMIIGEYYELDYGHDEKTVIKILDKGRFDIWAKLVRTTLDTIVNEKCSYENHHLTHVVCGIKHLAGYDTDLYKVLNETK